MDKLKALETLSAGIKGGSTEQIMLYVLLMIPIVFIGIPLLQALFLWMTSRLMRFEKGSFFKAALREYTCLRHDAALHGPGDELFPRVPDPGPCIPQGHRPVEHRSSRRGVGVDTEISDSLELVAAARRGLRQGRFNTAGPQYLQ